MVPWLALLLWGWVGWGMVYECVCLCNFFASFLLACLLIGGWVGVFLRVCCFDVVETSYEGHMVDALASRADEGRWSLR
jgi:hypothetical protein